MITSTSGHRQYADSLTPYTLIPHHERTYGDSRQRPRIRTPVLQWFSQAYVRQPNLPNVSAALFIEQGEGSYPSVPFYPYHHGTSFAATIREFYQPHTTRPPALKRPGQPFPLCFGLYYEPRESRGCVGYVLPLYVPLRTSFFNLNPTIFADNIWHTSCIVPLRLTSWPDPRVFRVYMNGILRPEYSYIETPNRWIFAEGA